MADEIAKCPVGSTVMTLKGFRKYNNEIYVSSSGFITVDDEGVKS